MTVYVVLCRYEGCPDHYEGGGAHIIGIYSRKDVAEVAEANHNRAKTHIHLHYTEVEAHTLDITTAV